MAIISKAPNLVDPDTVDPVQPPPKPEPLTESVSAKVGSTLKSRLVEECARLGVPQSTYIRSALEAKLFTTGA